jgi:hypothetical protein
MFKTSAAAALMVAGVAAQDPATGWMAYAVGSMPTNYERITRMDMYWNVGASASASSAFYSPWFGMDPADNLNLIQPVNPWFGSSWSMYTEYFQWSPINNSNSDQRSVESGQTLHGSLVYSASSDSYDLTQEIVETGVKSTQNVPCQNGKKFVVPYVVYEKTFPCGDYPPDGKVHFYNITVECDGQDCAKEIKWSPKVKDANCNMAAHINTDGTIDITWDTSMASKYDNLTRAELHDLNMHGWATKLDIKRPE